MKRPQDSVYLLGYAIALRLLVLGVLASSPGLLFFATSQMTSLDGSWGLGVAFCAEAMTKMKILFKAGLVALALGLVAGGAFASITFQASDTLGVNVFQQTSNNPCVIGDPSCKEPAGMTYNSQSGTPAGQGGTYDLSSPVYTALSPFTVPTSYSGNNIPTSFTIGVDENISTGAGAEQLVFFKTWICSSLLASSCTTLSTANSYIPGSPTDVPNEHNGNGFSDFILTGFSLTNGVHYLFEAEVMNDTDGMEEFFIIPAGSPAFTPEPGTLMLFGSGLLGIAGLVRRKLAK